MLHNLTLPDLGLDDQPMVVSSWLVKRGTHVAEGEPVLEVLCGGVTVDLPAPADGILARKSVAEGDPVTIGQSLGIIDAA